MHMPMIEYTLTWLESTGVEEAFVFCCAHSHQVKEYLEKAGWAGKSGSGSMAVTAVESHDAISAGDALRVIYDRGVVSAQSCFPVADYDGFLLFSVIIDFSFSFFFVCLSHWIFSLSLLLMIPN